MLCAPWATRDDLDEAAPAFPQAVTPERMDTLLLIASEILWALSGRQWSGQADPPCEATATLYAQRAGYCARPPTDSPGPRVRLPHDEVTSVVSVTSGGVPVVGWVRRGSWLVRVDHRSWGALGDVEVVYQYGLAPPEGGKQAAIMYALELARAEAGDKDCRLPKRVVSVVRQGVSMTLIDPQRYLDKGKLGIPDIDQWLMSVNPQALPERATFWSPDVPRAMPS